MKNYTFLINFVLVVTCLHLFKCKKHIHFYRFCPFYVFDVSAYFDFIYYIIGDDLKPSSHIPGILRVLSAP